MSQSTPEMHIWHASKMLTLGVIRRLDFNRKRYDETSEEIVTRKALIALLDQTLVHINTYQNLIHHAEESQNVAFETGAMILIHSIDNDLYRLHHKLLSLDVTQIEAIIPVLDSERTRWNPSGLNDDNPLPDIHQAVKSLQALSNIRFHLDQIHCD